ncbi:MAG: 2-oxoglutarate dehydrogenase complex dihydrolipoyllysine-residue succinyltransferase [Pseudomonadota bacterium]
MAIEIKAPQFPESVAEGTVATWHKKVGEFVERDELLVDIETDKVVLEVAAPSAGILKSIEKPEGSTVLSQECIAILDDAANKSQAAAQSSAQTSAPASTNTQPNKSAESSETNDALSPAVRKLMAEHNLNANDISASGKGGRLTKEDVHHFIAQRASSMPAKPVVTELPKSNVTLTPTATPSTGIGGNRTEKRVPMTRFRARVAERLMDAKNNTAMLTTFNEVNMQPVMTLRNSYKEAFEKTHSVRLGFMSFFIRAVVEALKKFPAVNASIDGQDIVYHSFYDIGVAVSSDRGLSVPIIRDADRKGFAELESEIMQFGEKARNGKLTLEDLTGGTFSVSNGGIFGSLLSTPILNPPQTAILGMHTIQERPVVENKQIVIRPMMYLALSYDHRLIDGKDAVQFLVAIKQTIEDPARLLLNL